MRPTRQLWSGRPADILGLAGGGVYHADDVTIIAVCSYHAVSPLPVPLRAIGCILSVALSRGSPRVAVSHRLALSCPDFPLADKTASDRPTHSIVYYRLFSIEVQINLLLFADCEVFLEFFVVSFRVVTSEVHSSAFPSFSCSLCH